METITIKLNSQTDRAKKLMNLINEMANDGEIQIQKLKTYNEVKRGIREMKQGKVRPINELFE
jgi:hypothetical protein